MTTEDCETSRLFSTLTEGNNEEEVRELIVTRADVNKVNRYGETALVYAVQQSNNKDEVRALIDAGADVNKTINDYGETALFYAVQQSNNESVVRALIDAGADINTCTGDGTTALFDAVKQSNNESVVRALITAGADVNRTDNYGATALFDAVQQSNNKSMVHALIYYGVCVNRSDNYGETALFDAVRQSNIESVVRAFIDAGADDNRTNDDGETALFDAVRQRNNESVVHALIDAGADVNKVNCEGKSALFYAVQEGDNESVARALIDAGVDINITDSAIFCDVQKSKNNTAVVRALIDAGADVNRTDNNGETALFYAVKEGNNQSLVHALIDAGADVNITNDDGDSASVCAVQQSNNETVVRKLIDAGADVNITCNNGATALFYAVRQINNESVVHELIDAGADVNETNNNGATALFYAVQQSNNEIIVRALTDAGALVNAKDVHHRTPLFYALHDAAMAHTLLPKKGGKQHLFYKDNCGCRVLEYFIEKNVLHLGHGVLFSSLTFPSSCLDMLVEHGVMKAGVGQSIMNIVISKFPLVFSRHSDLQTNISVLSVEHIIKALQLASTFMDGNGTHSTMGNLMAILKKDCKILEEISEVLQLLVELGADPNSVDSHGNTALHYATCLAWMGVPQETVMEVCHQLEELGVQFNLRNHENQTPLLYCLTGDLSKVKGEQLLAVQTLVNISGFLLKHGSSIQERYLSGETVFHLILNLFHQGLKLEDKKTRQNVLQEMIGLLQLFPAQQVAKAGIINIPDNHLNTPLHLWASLALPSPEDYNVTSVTIDKTFQEFLGIIFKYLLDCGVQLNVRNRDEVTPLHVCKSWSAVTLLLDAGANPNDVDSSGHLALLLAAMRIESIGNPVAFYPDISQSEDPKKFWETTIEKGLDPWTADKEGESVLRILLECESFVLAKALVEVACEKNYTQSEPFTICLLNAICKDKSTGTNWKTNLVQDILESRKAPTNLSEPLRLCCENIAETGVFDEVPEYEAVPIFANSDSEDDESLDTEPSVPIKKVKIDQSLIEAGIKKRSVHCEIIKILRSHGADGESCLDLTEKCPQLQDLLTEPLDNDTIPLLIPWNSVSKRYENNLAKVARRQEYKLVHDVFWYHKDHIASSSFGSVFVGINEKDGREVAIKRIEKLHMQRSEDKREITNLRALASCEQVVRYLHFFEDETFAYIILELMEGNLDEYISNGSTFEAGKSTQLCEDIVKGMKYLHEQDIIHRDLKPGNILFKTHPKLCLKIADFGLSRRINSTATTVYGTNAGTRCWIAPEVLMGTHDHSKSADMFSCGLVLHYILSKKKHPFSMNNSQVAHEIETNITSGKTKGWDKSLSPEATHLVKDMLVTSQENRPSAEKALNHPFFWSNQKKIDFLIAVSNQDISAISSDLEKAFSTIVKHGSWNDSSYSKFEKLYKIMTSVKKSKRYNTSSLVHLIRFIRNTYGHASENRLSRDITRMLFVNYEFLDKDFPDLVMKVYKVVIAHKWDQTKAEIKCKMNQ